MLARETDDEGISFLISHLKMWLGAELLAIKNGFDADDNGNHYETGC
jgi:hypothetical protein